MKTAEMKTAEMKTAEMKTAEIKLRAETITDRPFLATLFQDVRWEEWECTGLPEAQIRRLLEQQFQLQTADWTKNYPAARRSIIMLDGQPIGRIYEDWRAATKTVHVVDLSLLKPWRGRGIGSQLIRGMVTRAHARGYKATLMVVQGNPAQRMYERCGFIAVPDPAAAAHCRQAMECPLPPMPATRAQA
jgi:GNAT superfamily N-acetyltransferase